MFIFVLYIWYKVTEAERVALATLADVDARAAKFLKQHQK